MSDIATQIAYVSACRQIQRVKGVADLYIMPPISQYSVLDFGHFDEIKKVGLDFGRQSIDRWLASLPSKGKKYGWLCPPVDNPRKSEQPVVTKEEEKGPTGVTPAIACAASTDSILTA